MFSYYGSKSRVAKYYPKPEYDTIVEPFAGTASYSLLDGNWERNVILVDKYDVIARLWKWLQKCSRQDVLGLPRLKCGETVDDFQFDCVEAKWLVGFIITGAPSSPKKTASKWKTVIRPNTQNYKLSLIADSLHKIRGWNIVNGDYRCISNIKATWFVDAPYFYGGKYYKHSKMDYDQLKQWVTSRNGQAIVCENTKADWLPFSPLVAMHGNKYDTTEAMWTNIPHPTQMPLLEGLDQ